MSYLPLISHRLFVAAIGTEGNVSTKSSQNETRFSRANSPVTAVPIEVMASARPVPAATSRHPREQAGRRESE
jgi:hypothetical protein